MIAELHVRDLGVIADLDVVLDTGLTAITGETGAGKTLIVEALELLVGGRADPTMVRFGAQAAVVEARVVDGDDEFVLTRVVPAQGRSRAYLNGDMVPLSVLEERGRELVDLYGQHAHQSLLRPATQRAALDAYAGVDLSVVHARRAEIHALDEQLARLGGDDRARAREMDLLTFELDEITAAAITSLDEDDQLSEEEARLAQAVALREAASLALELLLGGDGGGARDLLGEAIERLSRLEPLASHARRLRGVAAELDDAADELRRAGEGFEEDPERLSVVLERRQMLARLVRKHGENLADVLAAAAAARERIAELGATDERRREATVARSAATAALLEAETVVGDARRAAAGALGTAVEAHLASLGLARASMRISVPDTGIGDDVEFHLSTNPGEPALPLAKVASGGELARTMLALRLVLSSAPPTLVFDEVDAGIGGEAALAVGRALAQLGREHQVLVVTHLAQVAAYADDQLVVEKSETEGRTLAQGAHVAGTERVIELSRMLSGRPDSAAARQHAAELLADAAGGRV